MNLRKAVLFSLAVPAFGSLGALAQRDAPQRTFVLVAGSTVETIAGDGRQVEAVQRYAQSHSGNYIVFAEGGALFRLERPEDLAEAARLAAPLRELGTKQEALAAKQAPLAKKQQELAEKMRSAAGPAEMGRIGEEQGRLGAEQGRIGEQQGKLGEQQGAAGKVLNDRVQDMIAGCLRDHSCKRVDEDASTK